MDLYATPEELQIAAQPGLWASEMLELTAQLAAMTYSTPDEKQIAAHPGLLRAEMLHALRAIVTGQFNPASPGPIGQTTPGTGNFTGLTVSGTTAFGPSSAFSYGSSAATVAHRTALKINMDPIYVFEGDSIRNPDPGTTAVPVLFNLYHCLNQGVIVNNCFSGQTAATILTQYVAQNRPYSPSVTGRAAWFIVNGGINDIFAARTAAAIYADLVALWALARADGFLVCATTLHNWTTNSTYTTVTRALNVLILSDPSLYDAVSRHDLILTGYRADWYADSTHGNAVGRAMLAKCDSRAIRGVASRTLVQTRLQTTSVQNFTGGTPAVVQMAVVSDPAGLWNSNAFTCPVAGEYHVSGELTVVTSAVASDTNSSRIYLNSTPFKSDHVAGIAITSKGICFRVNAIITAAAGDLITWSVDCVNNGVTVGNAENGWLTIKQLFPANEIL